VVEFKSNSFSNEMGQGSTKRNCFMRGSEVCGSLIRFGYPSDEEGDRRWCTRERWWQLEANRGRRRPVPGMSWAKSSFGPDSIAKNKGEMGGLPRSDWAKS
jgi:hypothetical protein